jgi:hypothetical protein
MERNMIINRLQKWLFLILITGVVLLASCQVSNKDFSEYSQLINPEIFEYLLEEINVQATFLVIDLKKFIQLYQLENLPKFETKPEPGIADNTETIVTFQVQVPNNTPLNDAIFISILDEVTGLALNAQHFKMEELPVSSLIDTSETSRYFSVSLPTKIGSVIKYRYERQTGNVLVAEHFSDGTPVRYRLYHVRGTGKVEDISSTWADSDYSGPTGRIIGEATVSDTEYPIPNLLITAGGAHTLTNSNGNFVIEGLPPGIHNLVAYAIDGSFITFQQGARIAPEATTPTPLQLHPSNFVDVTFSISVPEDTPPAVPIRIAGNLFQLGNTYADLSGGVNTLAERMPVLNKDPGDKYSITLNLPSGTDIRYKYTLGDGFWNAEHDLNGNFKLRQFIVPEKEIKVEDQIETWYSGVKNPLIFDPTIPNSTPQEDYLSIQFRPLFGWTEPIPMWKIAENRWAYILYSPLNLPGDFHYRYCRNGQCGIADDFATQGINHEGREFEFRNQNGSQTVQDQIVSWANYNPDIQTSFPISVTVNERDEEFWAGVEFQQKHHPSWMSKIPDTLSKISEAGVNWVVISPSWTYGSDSPGNNPPIFHQFPDRNALWQDVIDMSAIADETGIEVAHYPVAHIHLDQEEWWQNADRDYSWWLIWFDQYQEFILHHADLAQQAGAGALILGGNWISPALPEAKFIDGSQTGVPADSEMRWRELLTEVKNRFEGELLWAHPADQLDTVPVFIDQFDHLYIQLSIQEDYASRDENFTINFESEFINWLDNLANLGDEEREISLILSFSIPSKPDMDTQADIYQIIFRAINERDWIDGVVSGGFYPPAALQDSSPSIYGKPAFKLISAWFSSFLAEEEIKLE